MKDLYEIAAKVQGFLASQQWKFCFIGGLALQRWGEPRLTIERRGSEPDEIATPLCCLCYLL
jgi:hypothetical protein